MKTEFPIRKPVVWDVLVMAMEPVTHHVQWHERVVNFRDHGPQGEGEVSFKIGR